MYRADHYAWVIRNDEGYDKFLILSPFSEEKFSDWADLIAGGQYAATGQMILDDAAANKLLKELGYERVTEWKQQADGFYAVVRKASSWPEGTWGEQVNR